MLSDREKLFAAVSSWFVIVSAARFRQSRKQNTAQSDIVIKHKNVPQAEFEYSLLTICRSLLQSGEKDQLEYALWVVNPFAKNPTLVPITGERDAIDVNKALSARPEASLKKLLFIHTHATSKKLVAATDRPFKHPGMSLSDVKIAASLFGSQKCQFFGVVGYNENGKPVLKMYDFAKLRPQQDVNQTTLQNLYEQQDISNFATLDISERALDQWRDVARSFDN